MSEDKGGPIQIRTEIPRESSGRFVDALTDIIRPFSEKRGLKADQIRIQREEVLLDIAKKASERLKIERRDPNPVPNKFLIPFLEKCSLEELDNELCETWASLLVSAASDYSPLYVTFVSILSEMGPNECRVIASMVGDVPGLDLKYVRLQTELRNNQAIVTGNAHLLQRDADKMSAVDRFNRYKKSVEVGPPGHAHIYLAWVPQDEQKSALTLHQSDLYSDHRVSLNILERNALVRSIDYIAPSNFPMPMLTVRWGEATPLGIEFVLACSKRTRQ